MTLKNGKVLLKEGIRVCDVEFDSNITSVGKFSDNDCIDLQGLYVFPGFIDIHTHGGGGGDFMDAEDEAFDKTLCFHASNGTTSVVATSLTADLKDICSMLEVTRKYKERPVKSGQARVLGAHIEGPFLSLKNKGAQHESFLRVPAYDSYNFILDNADVIKTVTLAPELEGAKQMTKELTEKGIIVCGGHDDGCYENIVPVIEAGMSHCTHLWCAMSTVSMCDGLRSIGLVETCLMNDDLTAEIIADNRHITPEMIRLIYKCKGDKLCLVSDCLRAGGMPESDTLYTLGNKNDSQAMKFVVSDGVAKLPDKSRFAGSIQPLSQMVKNVVRAGIPLEAAVKMATSVPADIIRNNAIGRIRVGAKADFCIMDNNLNNVMTIIGGKVAYSKLNK